MSRLERHLHALALFDLARLRGEPQELKLGLGLFLLLERFELFLALFVT
jgi:hypothetical protein